MKVMYIIILLQNVNFDKYVDMKKYKKMISKIYFCLAMNPLLVIILCKYLDEAFGFLGLEGSSKSTECSPNFCLKNLNRISFEMQRNLSFRYSYEYPRVHSKLSRSDHAKYP